MLQSWLEASRGMVDGLCLPFRRVRNLLLTRRRRKEARVLELGAALILGGDRGRERAAMRLLLCRREELRLESWAVLPSNVPVIVSSGAAGDEDLSDLGLKPDAVMFDRRAVCTVTNFTTLISELKGLGVRGLAVITSEDHLPRALAVGELIAGAEGLVIHGVPITAAAHDDGKKETMSGVAPPETMMRTIRCVVRTMKRLVPSLGRKE